MEGTIAVYIAEGTALNYPQNKVATQPKFVQLMAAVSKMWNRELHGIQFYYISGTLKSIYAACEAPKRRTDHF